MSMIDVCRVCLRGDSFLYDMNKSVLRYTWERLTNVKFNINDGKPVFVCFLCRAHLIKSHDLMMRALKAEEFLTTLITKKSENTASLISNLARELDYNYVIELFDCDEYIPIEENNFEEIKKENVGDSEEDIEELQDIHVKVEIEENPVVNTVQIKDEDRPNEMGHYIFIKEETQDSTMEISPNPEESSNAVTVQVDVHHRHCSQLSASVATTSHVCVNETQATSDVSSIHPGYPKTAAERMREYRARKKKETLTVNHQKQKRSAAERAKEYRIRKKMKIHSGDFLESDHVENDVDNVRTETRLDGPSIGKRKVNEILTKSKHIKLKDTTKVKEPTTNSALKCSSNKDCKASETSCSKNVALESDTETSKRGQVAKARINCFQLNSVSSKVCNQINDMVPPKCVPLPNKKTLSFEVVNFVDAGDIEIIKPGPPKSASVVDPSTSLETGGEEDILKVYNKTEVNDFSCNICSYKCSTKPLFNVHMREHTGEKVYTCGLCDYKSSTKYSLKFHFTSKHTKKMNYSCHLCKYECIQKGNLDRHLRTHSGEKPYTCDICDYRCSRKDHLRNHIMSIHIKDMNYSCPVCQYKCLRRSDLNRHLQTHTGEKPFKCDLCGYRCALKGSLKSHIQFKHRK